MLRTEINDLGYSKEATMPMHGGLSVHSEFASNQFYSGHGEFRIGENSSSDLSPAEPGASIFIDIQTAFLAKRFATTEKNNT